MLRLPWLMTGLMLTTLPPAGAQEASVTTGPAVEVTAKIALPLGNATFTPRGRIIASHHPMFETAVRVSEIVSPDVARPFPSPEWNTPRPGTEEYLDAVLGLRSDSEGIVWMLDMGSRSKITPKLVAWDTRTDRLRRIIHLPPPVTIEPSQPNDLVIDERNGRIYISDEGSGSGGDGSRAALIVVDLATGAARRVLEGHETIRPANVPIVVDGREMQVQDKASGKTAPMRVGVDGIALDQNFDWLYFAPLNTRTVYRVRVIDLLNTSLDDPGLGARVERYAERPNGGGMSIDSLGNLYLTEVENRAVGVIGAGDRRYRRFATHPDMLWPDGLSTGPDGDLYVTISQLPLSPALNGGTDGSSPPYLMARFRPLAPGRLAH